MLTMTKSPIVLASTVLFVSIASTGAAASPNILVFIADDMGARDSGAYGHPHIRTPQIDQLATDGLLFTSAFLTCSSCSPSRASILTSRYPHNTGAQDLHMPLPEDQVVLAEPLAAGGYYTAAVGKWHLGAATKPEFDLVLGQVDRMVETLRQRPRDQPFFFWFAFKDPHRPYRQGAIETPHSPADAVVPPFLPDTEKVRRDFAMYYDEIARMDGVIGEVLAELDRQGAAKETIVVFLSDNGRPFPRCKTTVYDSGIQTPLIVRWPGHVPPAAKTDALVSSIDIAATLCELAGIAIPESFQGKSFSHVLTDPQADHRQYVFAEHNWHDYTSRQRAVRTNRFKYIRDFYPDLPETPPADAVRSPTYREMQRLHQAGKLPPAQSAIFETPRPPEALYDLKSDPYELHNLAGDPEFADELAALRSRLEQWQQQTRDTPPQERRPDEFDRETGRRLPAFQR